MLRVAALFFWLRSGTPIVFLARVLVPSLAQEEDALSDAGENA